MNKRSFITRICDNSSDWQRPTGPKTKNETSNTYAQKNGFGHEEWLFRSEWLIDGWRYAFLQGVNKSHDKLLKMDAPFDVKLFTIEHRIGRRYVATIHDVECLDEQQANEALKAFKKQGWYKKMLAEIRDAEGIVSALGNTQWAKHILNVRFRLENVTRFPPNTRINPDDPVSTLCRYQLVDVDKLKWPEGLIRGKNRQGTTSLPNVQSHMRRSSMAVTCTPEHARMQKKLMEALRAEYPKGKVRRERNYVDVSVHTPTELLLFEIKSDLDPRTVIRQALGQLLEYAYHPRNEHALPPQLVIVGRKPLSPQDADYIEILRKDYNLPLTYRVVAL